MNLCLGPAGLLLLTFVLAEGALCQAGESKPMKLPTPYTVDGVPPLGTYSVSNLEELALVAEVGMNVILGGHEDLDPNTPRGKFCRENGIQVMHHLTQHLYGRPRLGDAVTAEAMTLPLLEEVGANIPASGVIQIEDELIYYAQRTSRTLADCQRGYQGTQPAPHREGIILFWPQACEEEVRQIQDSPNLWGYYVLDDSPGDALSALRAMYQTIRRAEGEGPHHPVCAGYGSVGSLCNLGPGACDVMMIYWYPVSNSGYDRYMTSEQVQMRIGSDDDALVWLNGGEIWRHVGTRGLERDNDIVEVVLPVGESTILMKICNRAGMWGFFMRFTDLSGKPLEGLVFSPPGWIP